MGAQDVADGPPPFRQRQRQSVADVATDKLDKRLVGRPLEDTSRQLGKTEPLGGGQPVAAVDDQMVGGDEDRRPAPFQFGQAQNVSLRDTALPELRAGPQRLDPDHDHISLVSHPDFCHGHPFPLVGAKPYI
jgi:hypothetical protein